MKYVIKSDVEPTLSTERLLTSNIRAKIKFSREQFEIVLEKDKGVENCIEP